MTTSGNTRVLTPAGSARRGLRAIVIVVVIALLFVAVGWFVLLRGESRRITAYFGSTVGLYTGSAVRMLGVQIGTVDEVVPDGTQIRLTMTLDEGVSIPANAGAAMVAPSVVADRYVQLSPAYTAGPKMAGDAVIPRERTATTVELDELYDSLTKLATALGPDGANAGGALSELLTVAEKNMGGNGAAAGDTIRRLAEATRTLAGSKDDLFGTVSNLQKFTTMLATNDKGVEDFVKQLADIEAFLAGERDDIVVALHELAGVLDEARAFVRDGRGRIQSNVDKLESITRILVEQRAALVEAVDVIPNTISNVYEIYDPKYGVLDSRTNLLEFSHVTPPGADGAPVLPLPAADTPSSPRAGG